jgi:hypothetical protein
VVTAHVRFPYHLDRVILWKSMMSSTACQYWQALSCMEQTSMDMFHAEGISEYLEGATGTVLEGKSSADKVQYPNGTTRRCLPTG